MNPDFEYRFFDDDDVIAFIDRGVPEYREVFDSFPFPIQKYDFFRYLAVFRLGGFYFDTDVFFATGLNELLDAPLRISIRGIDAQPVFAPAIPDGLGNRQLRLWRRGRSSLSGRRDPKLHSSTARPGLGKADDAGHTAFVSS